MAGMVAVKKLFARPLAAVCFGLAALHADSRAASSARSCDTQNDSDIEYLIFWPPLPGANSESLAVGEFAAKLETTGDGKTRQLGFGVGIPVWSPDDWKIVREIQQGFDTAKRTNVAVHFNIDDHIGWENRPDLWNWHDRGRSGYNPANRNNVEWYDWEGTPNKRRYFTPDGVPSTAPHMCYNSKTVRNEIRRIISKVVGPALRAEIDKLKSDRQEYLFAGVTVGAEAGFDDYSAIPKSSRGSSDADPMEQLVAGMRRQAAKLMDEDEAPRGRLGYCALTNAGYSKHSPPPQMQRALADINQKFIEYWDKLLVDAGIPCSRIYTHIAASPSQDDSNNAPIRIAFNPYARPGWTTYPIGTLKGGLKPLYSELAGHGDPAWGGVEANAALADPAARVGWEAYLAWHFNHGARLVGVNVGATDPALMSNLSVTAFGAEAMSAYRKFLAGEPLSEVSAKAEPASASRAPLRSSPRAAAEPPLEKNHQQLVDTVEIIQRDAPAWLQAHPDKQSELGPLFAQLDRYLKVDDTIGAQRTADTILRLIHTGQ